MFASKSSSKEEESFLTDLIFTLLFEKSNSFNTFAHLIIYSENKFILIVPRSIWMTSMEVLLFSLWYLNDKQGELLLENISNRFKGMTLPV